MPATDKAIIIIRKPMAALHQLNLSFIDTMPYAFILYRYDLRFIHLIMSIILTKTYLHEYDNAFKEYQGYHK
jgi:hypothetical protein